MLKKVLYRFDRNLGHFENNILGQTLEIKMSLIANLVLGYELYPPAAHISLIGQ